MMVNAEAGLELTPIQRRGIKVDNLLVYPDPEEDVRITFQDLESLVRMVRSDLSRDRGAWAGVGWDTMSELHLVLKDNAVDDHKAYWDDIEKGYNEFTFNQQPSYGVMTEQLRRLIRGMLSAPCHFAMTCQTRVNEVGKIVPDINPALQNELVGNVNIAIYTRVVQGPDRKPIYLGDTVSGRNYTAKDRLALDLPASLVNPTMERLAGYLDGTITKDTDPDQEVLRALRAARRQG